MNKIFNGRYTARTDQPFVVFLIGMRINKWWRLDKWFPVASAMGPMLQTLFTHPEKGFLHAEFFWNFNGPVLIQYWRSFEDLERFARHPSDPHLGAWKKFNQAIGSDGSVGIWHETYTVNPDQFESVYGNMPRFGLAAAMEHVQAVGRRQTARKRLDVNKASELAMEAKKEVKKMTVKHVVFGTGAIGRAVMEELIQRGEPARMVNRSGRMDEVPAGVEVVTSDLYDQAKVKEVTRGAQVIYQAAQPNYNEWPEKFPLLQKSIIDGLTGSDSKLVLIENLYMYGETNGIPMTEDTPYNAHTRKGRVRGEISKAAFNAHKDGRLRVISARGGNFFGPWGTDSTMGARVFYPLLQGKPAQLIGRTDLPHSHTYVKDFGKALVILGESSKADGQAWHVPNDMPMITQAELARMFAEEAGVEPKVSSMGKLMMRIGGLFIPEAKESVEMMYEFDEPFIVDSSKFEKTFSMKATPMREAIKETVAWYKSHPQKH